MMGSKEGSVMVKNSNVFAALDALRKKKKSDKEKSKGSSKKEQEPEVLWAPAPLTVKSWADVDDEDDDDYYATTAPLQSFVGSNESDKKPEPVEETESEDDLLDEDEDVEDNDHESEVSEHADPVGQKIEASPVPKETERQLSKKERRKKELAELDSLLADFGVEQKEKGPDDLPDVANEKKEGQPAEDVEKKNGGATEPKSAKKKKKKDKASKEVKESEDQPNSVGATVLPEETGGAEQVEDASTVDMKERLKRVASAKKKKSGKETDGAARAAATEAAARSARLAAAKKKEKSHYNQQPMRDDQRFSDLVMLPLVAQTTSSSSRWIARDDQRFSDLVMLPLLAQTTSSSSKKTGFICGGGRWKKLKKAEATMVLGVGSR